jgi:hypothetical protein
MSQDTTFNPRSNVNLRRIKLTLISRLNQLELHLERLTEAQEQLIHTTAYLQQTSAPFLVLSYISSTAQYLDRQRTKITAATDAIQEAIRLLRELQLTEFSVAAASSSSILAPTASTVAAASSSSAIDSAASPAPRSFVRNLEIRPIPTVELVPRWTALLEKEEQEVQEARNQNQEQGIFGEATYQTNSSDERYSRSNQNTSRA